MRYFKLKCKQKHLYFAFKCYTSIFAHKRELFCQGNAFNAVRRVFVFTEFIKNTHLRRSFSRSIIQELKSSAKLRQSIYLKMVHSKLFLVHWMNDKNISFKMFFTSLMIYTIYPLRIMSLVWNKVAWSWNHMTVGIYLRHIYSCKFFPIM